MVVRRLAYALGTAAVAATMMLACGGSPPSGPTPQPPAQPPVVQPIVNTAPVIQGIDVGAERTEVDREVTLTARVTDAETPVDQLQYAWKADAGTFSGTGASVKWRAPTDQPTPRDYTISLTVTETYGTADASGVRPTNTATATSSAIRVHNSQKELGDMSLKFLGNFANSSAPVSACMVDFTDSCPGKNAEKNDVEDNRLRFQILSSSLNLRSVSVSQNQLSANMVVACSFVSRRIACLPDEPASCAATIGAVGPATGNCLLTGRYEQKRWWLCDSNFEPIGNLTAALKGFFGSSIK